MYFPSLLKKSFRRSGRTRGQRSRFGRNRRQPRLFLEQLEDRITPSALLTTDQPDYAPGDTATFLGSGFEVGENVNISIVADNGNSEALSVSDGGANDLDGIADGNFTTTWVVDAGGAYDGATITATATGDQGSSATTTFTDHAPGTLSFTGSFSVAGTTVTLYATLSGTSSSLVVSVEAQTSAPAPSGFASAMNDSGVDGDATAGDKIWTVQFESTCGVSFHYTGIKATLTDGHTITKSASPSILVETAACPTNTPPECIDDTADADEDGPAVTIDVLANDSDAEGDTLTVDSVDTTGTIGSVTNNGTDVTYDPNGQFDYLAVGETTTDTFSYTVSDGEGGFATCTVTVTIHGQNDAPDIAVDQAEVAVDEGSEASNSGTFSDIDSGDIVSLSASVGTVIDNGDGTWSWLYTPDDGPAETQTVTITATDLSLASSSVDFELTVNNVAPTGDLSNDGPIDEGSSAIASFDNIFDPSSADSASLHFFFSLVQADRDAAAYGDGGTDSFQSFFFADNGTYTVYARIIDKDDGYNDYQTDIEVNNVDPTMVDGPTLVPPAPCNTEGGGGPEVSVSGSFYDPGDDDYTVTIDWGDSTTTVLTSPGDVDAGAGTHSYSAGHVYTTFGTFYVTVTVDDDDGGSTGAVDALNYPVVIQASAAIVTGDPVWGTVLDMHGTDLRDVITVNQNIENGVLVYKVHANSWLSPQTFAAAGISKIRINLCNGDDQAAISDGIKAPSIVFGGQGNDHINAGKAVGDAILIGGDGNDTLVGGAARDLLIGGNGSDRIVGGAGDDILLAGRTSFDGNSSDLADQAMLKAIMTVWNSGASYASRACTIKTTYLIADGAGQTLFSDNAVDTLTGGSGQDLFFANTTPDAGDSALDVITDLAKNEQAVDIDDV